MKFEFAFVSRALILAPAILAVGVQQAAAQGRQGGARIEAQPVGPYAPTSTPVPAFSLSARGVHLAVVIPKGTRSAVSVDGVEGPRFDEIVPVPGGRDERVTFSNDGTRHAYVGKLGQELVAMVDGKEVLRVPAASFEFAQLPGLEPNPGFTANGKHVYMLLYNRTLSGASYTMYLDGVPGPKSGEIPRPYFSPDGSHVACVVTNPANREQKALILDGKPAGYPPAGMPMEGTPVFTGDGAHLFVYGLLPRGAGMQVFIDGRPYLKAPNAQVFTAPAGNLFVTRIVAASPGGGPVHFLDIAGKRVPGSDGATIDTVYFSRDGKHWAAHIRSAANTSFILADGKKGLDYQAIGNVEFTEDGRAVYVAQQNGRSVVVVGEEESEAYQGIAPLAPTPNGSIMWAMAGNRIGFIATPGPGGAQPVVVDGKVIARRAPQNLEFSPDGSRFAFAYSDGINVDGVDYPSGAPSPFAKAPTSLTAEPAGRFLFSPDGKRVVHFGVPAGGNSFGIFMDGNFLPVGNRSPYNPTFTPDGRHLFWMDTTPGEPRFTVYLDGVPVLKIDFNNLAVTRPGWWEMGPDGTLTVAGIDEGVLKRIRIIPGGDTNIETMMAKMTKVR